MANVLVAEESLQAIADAIREKNGLTDTYTPAQMAPAILEISGGGIGEYTSYLYYRLYITDFSRDTSDAREFQNIADVSVIGDGGMNIAATYGVEYTASSVYSSSSAAYAFDGDPDTLWESDWQNVFDTTGWVKVKLDEPRPALAFKVTSRVSQRDYPHVFQIQGSNDDVSWDTLVSVDETVVSRTSWQKGSSHAFFVTAS